MAPVPGKKSNKKNYNKKNAARKALPRFGFPKFWPLGTKFQLFGPENRNNRGRIIIFDIGGVPGGGFAGPSGGFGGPGGGFSNSRSSGKPLLLLRLKKPPPGAPKP